METFKQVISALYVAFGEAAGPRAIFIANRVLRDAITDRVVDDPTAVLILESLSQDEDDLPLIDQQLTAPLDMPVEIVRVFIDPFHPTNTTLH